MSAMPSAAIAPAGMTMNSRIMVLADPVSSTPGEAGCWSAGAGHYAGSVDGVKRFRF
jgi:hypothetical protein